MVPEPYIIELRGGRFDGCRMPVRFVPPRDHLELPASSSSLAAEPSSSRAVVYQFKGIHLTQLDGLPTLVYRYDYAGTRRHTLDFLREELTHLADSSRRLVTRAFFGTARTSGF